jgi:hypothetical protein
MKRGTTLLCTAAALAYAAVAGAQTQQRQPQQHPSAAAQTVTLIGCIEPGASANAFMLNVLEHSGAGATATTGRQPDASISGQARVGDTQVGISGHAQIEKGDPDVRGTAGMNFVGRRLQLIGDARTNLRAHVGHQVEITGTLAPQTRGTTGAQTAAVTRVTVRNVRMISEKCAAVATSGASTTSATPTAATTTFIGCVERGTMPNSFVLSITDTAGDNVIGQRVQLSGGGNLAAHAGHKVQITGMMVPQGTPLVRGGQPAAEMRLNVSNVTMLATTCTPAAGAHGTTGTTGTIVEQPETPPQQQ